MGVVEPAIWAMAGAVGLARTLDRAHWASDQLIGAAFGYAVGRQIALRSKRRRADRRSAETSNHSGLFVSPQRGALKLGWNHPL
jgi:membrane-associated phospholipid phosphatase